MIDCMESRLSRRIRPLILEEHHLLSVWVTHSAALMCTQRSMLRTHHTAVREPDDRLH